MASTEPVQTNWNPIQASYIITLNIYILVENQYTQHDVSELPAKIPCTLLGDIIGICDQKWSQKQSQSIECLLGLHVKYVPGSSSSCVRLCAYTHTYQSSRTIQSQTHFQNPRSPVHTGAPL